MTKRAGSRLAGRCRVHGRLTYGGGVDAPQPRPAPAGTRRGIGEGRRGADVARRVSSLLLTVALLAVVLGSVGASARIAYVGFGRHDVAELLDQQLRWLEPQVVSGRPVDSEVDIQDGEVLQLALTALASARDEGRPAQTRVPLLRTVLGRLDAPTLAARYATPGQSSPGAFLQSWSLLVAGELARLSGEEADRAALRARSARSVSALGTVVTGILPSYGDTYRPVDTVVLAAALRRADAVAGVPGAAAAIEAWLLRLDPVRDPTTKLLPHSTDSTGRPLDGPRATSQGMIQVFWPSIDVSGATSSRDWVAFENTFLCPRLGLAAVCEFPGGGGGGDAVSGPLMVGVSPAATVITMAAARRHGNGDLAEQISREAELFGLPQVDHRGRRYVNGSAPVGDALLAWARSVPLEPERPGVDDRDEVAWSAWTMCALIPAVLALGALAWRFLARRRFGGPLESNAAPPDPPYGPPGLRQSHGAAGNGPDHPVRRGPAPAAPAD